MNSSLKVTLFTILSRMAPSKIFHIFALFLNTFRHTQTKTNQKEKVSMDFEMSLDPFSNFYEKDLV